MAKGSISFDRLKSNADQDLVLRALDASARAYAPYSGFAVGAAIRMADGKTFYSGANFENASYGVTMCAEVSALAQLHRAGDFAAEAIAVVGHKFTEPKIAAEIVSPCGRCRQLIAEVAQHGNSKLRVLCCSGDLQNILIRTIEELLPQAFGPQNLGVTGDWPGLRQRLAEATGLLWPTGWARPET